MRVDLLPVLMRGRWDEGEVEGEGEGNGNGNRKVSF